MHTGSPRLPRKPLAAGVAALFALSAPHAFAACMPQTWTITSCGDDVSGSTVSKTGTLRFALANACGGSIIDLSQLPTAQSCSIITLGTGGTKTGLTINQNSLTLQGPPSGTVTIGGKYGIGQFLPDRLITHNGTGTLTLNGLTLSAARPYSSTAAMKGGCVYSKGAVALSHSAVYGCIAKGKVAMGGGIAAAGGVALSDSIVSGNTALDNGQGYTALGGGIATTGPLIMRNSTVSANQAQAAFKSGTKYAAGGPGGVGGGIYAAQGASIVGSTISNNTATNALGGITVGAQTTPYVAEIVNSTISGNSAFKVGGAGLYVPFSISHSTVAYNSATLGCYQQTVVDNYGSHTFKIYSPAGLNAYRSIVLNNSIFTGNTYQQACASGATLQSDIQFPFGNATTTGSNNIIVVSKFAPPPTLTNTTTACPLLGPLRDNGGPTQTHALLSHSPGIDAGGPVANDPDTGMPLAWDQRGSPYARADNTVPDIGAYEVQQGDVIFNAGFDGCG